MGFRGASVFVGTVLGTREWVRLLEAVALAVHRAANGALHWRYCGKPLALCELDRAGAPSDLALAERDRDALAGALLRYPPAFCGELVGNAIYRGDNGGNGLGFR